MALHGIQAVFPGALEGGTEEHRRAEVLVFLLPFYQTVDDRINRLLGSAREMAGYLSAHYLGPLSLDDLAERLRYTPSSPRTAKTS